MGTACCKRFKNRNSFGYVFVVDDSIYKKIKFSLFSSFFHSDL